MSGASPHPRLFLMGSHCHWPQGRAGWAPPRACGMHRRTLVLSLWRSEGPIPQNSPLTGALVPPALHSWVGCSLSLPGSQEGTAGSWHMPGSGLTAPSPTPCSVYVHQEGFQPHGAELILERCSWNEGLCLLLLAGAGLWRVALDFEVVLQLR